MIHVKTFASQKRFIILLLLKDIMDWVLFTINTICSIKGKLGLDIELQNKHIVLFKSPPGMKQLTTLSAQLGLGSELVDWCRDATSEPFGHLLIDLPRRTDNRLRYFTDTRSILSRFNIRDRLKQSELLEKEHSESLYCPNVSIPFPVMQKSFPFVFSEKLFLVPPRMYSKSSQRKPAMLKKTSPNKTDHFL